MQCVYEDRIANENVVFNYYIAPLIKMNHSLEQLQIFEMEHVRGTKIELNFIRYVLQNTPLLQQMKITAEPLIQASDNHLQWFLSFSIVICKFKKASPCAKIIVN